MAQTTECDRCTADIPEGANSCAVCGFSDKVSHVETTVTARLRSQKRDAQAVIITDLDMPFTSMVRFMVKWAIATIPAALILVFVVWVAMTLLTTLASR
ncbi:MAG: hypothetical protein QOI24_2767 [Acidobacteriota bacterium]|jgi:CHASE2 domain-containing sensor protein|nr:hypothetical protein [Acidobacteriota bacterium]